MATVIDKTLLFETTRCRLKENWQLVELFEVVKFWIVNNIDALYKV